MFLDARILYMFTETPLHAGTGSTLGVVDLPIQRERSTSYPTIYASSLKGALRSQASGNDSDSTKVAVFGPVLRTEEGDTTQLYAGAVSPGDARILLFPVRSLAGVYAWTTSLGVLQRLVRDAQYAGITHLPALPAQGPGSAQAYASGNDVLCGSQVTLEEFTFTAIGDETTLSQVAALADWLALHALPGANDVTYDYWREKLRRSLVILPEEAFRDFCRYSTEVNTRVRLVPDSKTVQPGALWTEECLPVDVLMYAPVFATPLRAPETPALWKDLDAKAQASQVLKWMSKAENVPERIQIGGDETVGRGIVRLRWEGGLT